jgi:tetratricopeptide (TPR) repeat protein
MEDRRAKTHKRGGADVTTWGQVGVTGKLAAMPISLYGRNSASGTYGYFKEHSLKGGDYKNSVKEQPGSASVVEGVAKDIAAIGYSGIGQENFNTLSTLASLQEANGQLSESKQTLEKALNHPTASVLDLHTYARNLQRQKKTPEAIRIFELNAKRFPNVWPTEVGLMRGYSAQGNFKEALKHARLALKQAPDAGNRQNLEQMIKLLEQGKDVN